MGNIYLLIQINHDMYFIENKTKHATIRTVLKSTGKNVETDAHPIQLTHIQMVAYSPYLIVI
jgi:hypothetical protein